MIISAQHIVLNEVCWNASIGYIFKLFMQIKSNLILILIKQHHVLFQFVLNFCIVSFTQFGFRKKKSWKYWTVKGDRLLVTNYPSHKRSLSCHFPLFHLFKLHWQAELWEDDFSVSDQFYSNEYVSFKERQNSKAVQKQIETIKLKAIYSETKSND